MDESLTIPKLELTALLLGCCLAKHLSKLLPGIYASVTVWFDTSTALQWVHNSKSNSPYVLNRMEEIIIIKLTCNINLKHVPTNNNPANLASCGVTVRHILKNKFWLQGPPWLSPPSEYPDQSRFSINTEICSCPIWLDPPRSTTV
ncbi:uncharacterized protein [Palaemon carinicauda]|uniref:uncharacterized protein n=1 Tax=Palaemon carinicauda TaxID=392227 RepID=UPI0035B69FF8